jgi:hypothetical protein
MSLQFIGDAGVYLPERDAVKITAIVGDSVIDCYVTRSALEVLGCKPTDQAHHIAQKFEARRLDCEIAALVKFRRATAKVLTLEITSSDLAAIEKPRAA